MTMPRRAVFGVTSVGDMGVAFEKSLMNEGRAPRRSGAPGNQLRLKAGSGAGSSCSPLSRSSIRMRLSTSDVSR